MLKPEFIVEHSTLSIMELVDCAESEEESEEEVAICTLKFNLLSSPLSIPIATT